MTTVALVTAPPPVPSTRRAWNAVRRHVANPWPVLIAPWLIFAAVFALNLAIWRVILTAAGGRENLGGDAFGYSGGASWILFFLAVVAVQAMSLTFRFALGLGMTRRDYYLGTSVFLVLLGLSFATGMTVLAAVERATDGWGLGGRFFTPGPIQGWSLGELWWVLVMTAMLFAFVGVVAATAWVRWKALGLYLVIGGTALLLIGAAWLMTVTESWGPLGTYLGEHSPALSATWTLPVTLACGV
ncbi:MAG TPA: hypothetical protein PKB06_06805, partial [Actinotalea sp.]|nr:hypothetical protein [Actinotalea sp.]